MELLRVFVSGTQTDLLREREVASRAIASVGLMQDIRCETTLSQSESPIDWIRSEITDCDIYVGIYSHRYGWVVPGLGISATEFEFNLANELGKPILVWIRTVRESEKALQDFEMQERFLRRVSDFSSGYLRQEFDNSVELEALIAPALRDNIIRLFRSIAVPAAGLSRYQLLQAYLEQLDASAPSNELNIVKAVERTVHRDPACDSGAQLQAFDGLEPTANRLRDSESIFDALERERRILLLGDPGAGKTTSLIRLSSDLAQRARGVTTPQQLPQQVPVFVELKYYNGENQIESLIARSIENVLRARNLKLSGAKDSAEVIKALVACGIRFTLLIDGLNEVRDELYTALQGMLRPAMNSPYRMVISCRERDYDKSFRHEAPAFVLDRLTEKEIQQYVREALGERGEHLYNDHLSDGKLTELAANPLMLGLIINAFRMDDSSSIPGTRAKLLRHFVEHMPVLRQREGIRNRVPVDIVIGTLAKLAREMQDRGRLSAQLGEVRSWRLPLENRGLEEVLSQGKDWRFLRSDGGSNSDVEYIHEVFQEYFAAVHLFKETAGGISFGPGLTMRAFNPGWREAISLYAEMVPDRARLLEWLHSEFIKKDLKDLDEVIDGLTTIMLIAGDSSELNTLFVKRLCDGLEDRREPVRVGVVFCLGTIGGPQAVEPILRVAKDRCSEVRRAAVVELASLGGSQAVHGLVAALKDKDEQVVCEAAHGLSRVGGDLGFQSLVSLLRDKRTTVIVAGISGLADLADTRATASLRTLLQSSEVTVRSAVVRALGKIKDEASLELLVRAIGDQDKGVADRAGQELGQFGPLAVKPLISALSNEADLVRKRAALALGRIGLAAVAPVISALRDPRWSVRLGAVNVLQSMVRQSLFPQMAGDDLEVRRIIRRDSLEPLLSILADGRADLRRATLSVLCEFEDRQIITHFIACLGDEDKEVRRTAVEGLARLKDEDLAPVFVRLLGDPDWRVSSTATSGLVDIGEPCIPVLISALCDRKATRNATDALEKIGRPAFRRLLRLLGDPEGDQEAIRAAARILSTMGERDAVLPLVNLLRHESTGVRLSAALALIKLPDPRARDPLISTLQDQNAFVRSSAAHALVSLGGPAVIEATVRTLDSQSAPARQWAAFILGEIGGREVLGDLERVAEEDDGGTEVSAVAKAAGEAIEKVKQRSQVDLGSPE
jgi:HEAT repeat protein